MQLNRCSWPFALVVTALIAASQVVGAASAGATGPRHNRVDRSTSSTHSVNRPKIAAGDTTVGSSGSGTGGSKAQADRGPGVEQPDTVYRWGAYFGGGGTSYTQRRATPVAGLSGVEALAASNSSNYALVTGGTVWAWGDGRRDQLGDGSQRSSFTAPVQVTFPTGTTITAIGEGFDSGYAVDSTGHGWAWGSGAMCTADDPDRAIPEQIPSLSNLVAVSGGGSHVMWLTSSGTVYTCGSNNSGQLGNGNYTTRLVPQQVTGLPTGATGDAVVAISAGNNFSTALLANGEVWDWGQGSEGQLGNGNNADFDVPVQVELPQGTYATQVYAGGDTQSDGQQVAMLDTGEAVAWGVGTFGQLGDGQRASENTPVPISIPTGVTFVFVATGGASSYAIDSNGNLWAWGANFNGELSRSNKTPVFEPVEIETGVSIVSATAEDVVDYS
jgi:alpha-tubulin suppressor-like RCC1 family protein